MNHHPVFLPAFYPFFFPSETQRNVAVSCVSPFRFFAISFVLWSTDRNANDSLHNDKRTLVAIYFKTFILPWLFFLSLFFFLPFFLSFSPTFVDVPLVQGNILSEWWDRRKEAQRWCGGSGSSRSQGQRRWLSLVEKSSRIRARSDESPAPKRLKSAAHTPTRKQYRRFSQSRFSARSWNGFPGARWEIKPTTWSCTTRAALPRSTFLSSFQPVTDRSGKNRDHLDLKLTKNPWKRQSRSILSRRRLEFVARIVLQLVMLQPMNIQRYYRAIGFHFPFIGDGEKYRITFTLWRLRDWESRGFRKFQFWREIRQISVIFDRHGTVYFWRLEWFFVKYINKSLCILTLNERAHFSRIMSNRSTDF